MAEQGGPSYTELVYDVLRSAGRPLPFQEIFDAVNRRRPVTTRNPKGTIRNALSQGRQLVNVGEGRYGYLPHLVSGSLLRVPLSQDDPADHPLVLPDEVRHALHPSFLEIQKRRTKRPARARLPDGDAVALSLEHLGTGIWGSPVPDPLRRYLIENQAAAGDSLLVRVIDGEAGLAEVWLEPRRQQDQAAVEARNQQLADAAHQILLKGRSGWVPTWDVVIPLLAQGYYRSEVVPDPLKDVMSADPRCVPVGYGMWLPAEAVPPDVEAEIRLRERLMADVFSPGAQGPANPDLALSPLSSRLAMERSLADIGALLAGQEFGSLDEANTFLGGLMASGGLPARRPTTPLEEAQDLMYEAWDSPDPRERVRLARQALAISPDCADAYVLLAGETARTPKQAADLYAQGVAAGERALGKDAFADDVGHFWGLLETRPYMRARLGLAPAQWALAKRQQAIDHLWDMLRLNPGDNQGVRYVLLNWLLEMGDAARVDRLLDLYPDDGSAVWQYGQALHAFHTEGNIPHARQMLAEAKAQNPFVPPYLLGKKRLPRELPPYVGFGDESEATYCAAEQMAAWQRVPGALAWLRRYAG